MSPLSIPVSIRRLLTVLLVCALALPGLLPWRLAADTTAAKLPELIPQATNIICHCRVSPDGKYMVTLGSINNLIWNLSSGLIENRIPDLFMPEDAIFSPDSRYLLIIRRSAYYPSTVVWDMQQGITVQSWDEDTIRFARFTPDSKQVWVGSDVKGSPLCTLSLRNIADGKVVRTVSGLTGIYSVSPDGMKAITSDAKSGPIVYEINSGQQLSRLAGCEDYYGEFSPDSNTYMAYSSGQSGDHDIGIWNCTTGEQVQTLPTDAAVDLATFSQDGSRVAASVANKTVIWDVGTGHVLQTLTHAPHPKLGPEMFDCIGIHA